MDRCDESGTTEAEQWLADGIGIRVLGVRRRSDEEFDLEFAYASCDSALMGAVCTCRGERVPQRLSTAWLPELFLRAESIRRPERLATLAEAAGLLDRAPDLPDALRDAPAAQVWAVFFGMWTCARLARRTPVSPTAAVRQT